MPTTSTRPSDDVAGSTKPERDEADIVAFYGDPVVVHRHYVMNYFDLIEYVFGLFFVARDTDSDITIEPGKTVGEAFNITEHDIGVAMAGEREQPSIFMELIANMLTDIGIHPALVDGITIWMRESVLGEDTLTICPTFEEKADKLKTHLDGFVAAKSITQAQANEINGVFRSVGKLIVDGLAIKFPKLTYRVELEENDRMLKTLEFDSSYVARLSGDPSEVLRVEVLEDCIEIRISAAQFVISNDASVKVIKYKKKKAKEKEKWEAVTGSAAQIFGPFSFNDVTLRLQLHDKINASHDYPWGLGSPVHHARYNDARVDLNVGSVDVMLLFPPLLIDFFEGLGRFVLPFVPSPAATAELESLIANLIRTTINSNQQASEIVSQLSRYVTPITDLLVPDAYGLSNANYHDIWGRSHDKREIAYGRFETLYGRQFVEIRNILKKESDLPHGDPDNVRFPEDEDRDTVFSQGKKTRGAALGLSGGGNPAAVLGSAGTATERARVFTNENLPFDPAVWKTTYDEASPLQSKVGKASDPAWIGLSSNCVAATQLFRALRSNNRLTHKSEIEFEQKRVSYKVKTCADIAADFTGRSFFGAPALVVRDLQLTASLVEPNGSEPNVILVGAQTGQPAPLPIGPPIGSGGGFPGGGPSGGTGTKPGGSGGFDIPVLTGESKSSGREYSFNIDLRARLKATLPDVGCLPNEAVPHVAHNLKCIEAMCGGEFKERDRSTKIEQRNYVYLDPDLAEHTHENKPVPPFEILDIDGSAPSDMDRYELITAIVRDWLRSLPAVPIFHNSFYMVGGEVKRAKCDGGWITVYGRYPFPDFSRVNLP